MAARAFVGIVAALALAAAPASSWGSGSYAALDRELAASLETPGVISSSSTAEVVELPSGRVVFAHDPYLSLEPASNEKLAVTYTALAQLGPGYRFPTELLGEGVRRGHVWRGNLVLKGFGDPSLTSADLGHLVAILWREGIRRVTGTIVGDASFFDDDHTAPGWLPSFAGLESPPLSALVVDRATFDGRLVGNPPLAAAIDLDALLHARGISAGRARAAVATPAAVVLATIYSEPLSDLLEFMDQVSDNFTAEMILKAIGAQAYGLGTTAGGARVVRAELADAGVPLTGVRIVDGSGLSRWDRITASELSALLVAIWRKPYMRTIVLDGLPIAGETGTLIDRMTSGPARGLVRAKTGTTDIASALSGFVGSRYAFVSIENGRPVDWIAAHAAQDDVADALAAQVTGG